MQWRVRQLLIATCLVLVGCGSSHDGDESSGSTKADLCAGAYPVGEDGIATIKGCAFENQLNNVYTYGSASTPLTLFDADGQRLASAVRSCDAWWQATDAEGVTILANMQTGEIRAHGMAHKSMPSTQLSRFVPAPMTAR